MSDPIKIPQKSLEAIHNAQKSLQPLLDQYNAMLVGVKTALEVPEGWSLNLETGTFNPPVEKAEKKTSKKKTRKKNATD